MRRPALTCRQCVGTMLVYGALAVAVALWMGWRFWGRGPVAWYPLNVAILVLYVLVIAACLWRIARTWRTYRRQGGK